MSNRDSLTTLSTSGSCILARFMELWEILILDWVVGTGDRLVGLGDGEGEEESKSDWTGMIFFFFFVSLFLNIPEVASLYEGRLD